MSGFEERYEISCSQCGVLCHEATLEGAVRIASMQVEEARHGGCEDVMVYDRMAHVGMPELYEPTGEIRSRRIS